MKKIILVSLVLLLAACAPEPTSSAVVIPEAVVIGVSGLLLSLFTAGFVYLFELVRLDLRGVAIPLSAGVSTWIVTEMQNWINIIPDVYDPALQVALTILGVLLAGAGALRLFSRQPRTLL